METGESRWHLLLGNCSVGQDEALNGLWMCPGFSSGRVRIGKGFGETDDPLLRSLQSQQPGDRGGPGG